jgi:hypothetical protein
MPPHRSAGQQEAGLSGRERALYGDNDKARRKNNHPGLSSMIDVKEPATLLTNWCFKGNTSGAIYGFEHSMDNA